MIPVCRPDPRTGAVQDRRSSRPTTGENRKVTQLSTRGGWRSRCGGLSAPAASVLLLVVLAVTVRLPGIQRPLLGTFATKNCVYAMIARNWASGRAPWYLPTVDQLVGGERGWHLTELPVSVYLPAAAWALLGGSLDAWGRAASIAWSAGAAALLYLLMRRRHGALAAAAAAAALAVSPVSIIYGQSFMLESAVAALSILCIWANDVWWQSGRWSWLGVLALATCVLLLTKPYMVVLVAALAAEGWRAHQSAGWAAAARPATVGCPNGQAALSATRKRAAWALALGLAAAPSVTWCAWVWSLSAPGALPSEHVYFSLRRSASEHSHAHSVLCDQAFYVQAVRNLCGPVLTPLGAVLAVLGFGRRAWRPYAPWLASCLLLVLALPLKFQALNYYYLAVLPPLCALVGLGCENAWRWLQQRSAHVQRAVVLGIVLISTLLYVRFAWRPAFVTPEEDRMVQAAAAALREVSDPADRVITMHGSTLSLLYYCDREGWAINAHSPRFVERWTEAVAGGARWVVATRPGALAHLPQVQTRLAQLRPVRVCGEYCVYLIGKATGSTDVLAR